MPTPLVSVLLPIYNAEPYLAAALESIQAPLVLASQAAPKLVRAVASPAVVAAHATSTPG